MRRDGRKLGNSGVECSASSSPVRHRGSCVRYRPSRDEPSPPSLLRRLECERCPSSMLMFLTRARRDFRKNSERALLLEGEGSIRVRAVGLRCCA